ncbi:MAG: CopG family transcriptional regulator [Mailhella sp.]|nr:CopG family transcriptional regulator [Mailhella sp.]
MSEKQIGIVGIIVEDRKASPELHCVLHKHADIIVGRQGIPFRDSNVSVISIVVEGSAEQISALTEEVGGIALVSSKAVITSKK